MSLELVRVETGPRELGPLAAVADTAREYIRASKSDATRRAYRGDWSDFTAWCRANGAPALPASPDTVVLYVTAAAASHAVSTLTRRLAAISQAHKTAGYDSPTGAAAVRAVMTGIRRAKGTAQNAKAPTMTDDIRAMVAALPAGLLGVRDRALLLVGFAGAFRRSELVGLDQGDVETTRDGLVITLRRSKTDQEGEGRKVAIPYGSNPDTCPVRALDDWLAASGITTGPLFRYVNRHGQLGTQALSGFAVSKAVKRAVAAAGLDASKYSGHSLRAGLATSAAAAGVSERIIMKQTGHRSVNMVRRYIRDGSLFRENAAGQVGL
ncbi:MAG TPA: tyrosine-type recombinase/integrase [Bryobacteraceae bacterium]|nr:tyrosine-type recombinase/integrase [Bryobacteraceae bacterium]